MSRLPHYMFGVLRRDLMLHLTAYGGLSFVYFGGRSHELRPHMQHSTTANGDIQKHRRSNDGATHTACVQGIAVLLVHSLVKEVVQSFVPGRDGALDDVGADMCGIAVGLAAVWVLLRA